MITKADKVVKTVVLTNNQLVENPGIEINNGRSLPAGLAFVVGITPDGTDTTHVKVK